jgi:putative transposase
MRDLVCAETARSGISIAAACEILSVSRATFYRGNAANPAVTSTALRPCRVPGTPGVRGLSLQEQERILQELHSDRFMDLAPPQVYATLLDEGSYLCSISTMYRLLHKRGEVVERRRLRAHTQAKRPELLATGPNQVWSWDITKLKGPRKWSYYYLYVILDVFSRCVVGWCIAERENAAIAEALIQETLLRENIPPGALTIHADRGSAMTSTTVAELLIDLGVIKSHSRPHTSNDNPYSESHFKTMKYRPQVPDRFESVEEARSLFRNLFCWYNHEHHHSGLALLTPAMVHHPEGTRQGRRSYKSARQGAGCGLRSPSRAVRKEPAAARRPPGVSLDQCARAGGTIT